MWLYGKPQKEIQFGRRNFFIHQQNLLNINANIFATFYVIHQCSENLPEKQSAMQISAYHTRINL